MAFSFLKNLFASEPKGPDYDHRVWASQEAKWKQLVQALQAQAAAGSPVLLLVWFPKTMHQLTFLLREVGIVHTTELNETLQTPVLMAMADDFLKQAHVSLPANMAIWMVEHYPLHTSELAVFEKARQKFPAAKPVIFTSLDEQLFAAFGGDRVKSMMASMGGGPDEMIEHNLVKASVVKAQQKVEEGIITELKAQSDEEWFRKNYKKAL